VETTTSPLAWGRLLMVPTARTAREARILRTVSEILNASGPRPPGSEAEKQAGGYVYDRLQKAGLDVSLQDVPVGPHSLAQVAISYALVVMAAILLSKSALVGAVLAAVGVASLAAEDGFPQLIHRRLPHRHSFNVIGVRKSNGSALRRIILVAHLDSAQPTLFSHPRAVPIRRQSFALAFNASLIILVLGILGCFFPLGGTWWAGLAAGLYLLFHLTVLVHGMLNMPPSLGANDNASGLAVLIELAEQLRSPQQSEIWFVATAGDEAGFSGMRQLLQEATHDSVATFVINLYCVGAGSINLTLAEGFLRGRSVSHKLLETGAHVVHDIGLPVQAHPLRHTATQSYLALRARVPAISIVGLDERGTIPNWHWGTDTLENVDPAAIDIAAQLAGGIVSRLDAHTD